MDAATTTTPRHGNNDPQTQSPRRTEAEALDTEYRQLVQEDRLWNELLDKLRQEEDCLERALAECSGVEPPRMGTATGSTDAASGARATAASRRETRKERDREAIQRLEQALMMDSDSDSSEEDSE